MSNILKPEELPEETTSVSDMVRIVRNNAEEEHIDLTEMNDDDIIRVALSFLCSNLYPVFVEDFELKHKNILD